MRQSSRRWCCCSALSPSLSASASICCMPFLTLESVMDAINRSSPPIAAPRAPGVGSAGRRPSSWRGSRYGFALCLLLLMVLACVVLPLVPAFPAPVGGSVVEANLPILSHGHFFGTDTNGNDVLSRILHGGRT